jgi:hypothetical protein
MEDESTKYVRQMSGSGRIFGKRLSLRLLIICDSLKSNSTRKVIEI